MYVACFRVAAAGWTRTRAPRSRPLRTTATQATSTTRQRWCHGPQATPRPTRRGARPRAPSPPSAPRPSRGVTGQRTARYAAAAATTGRWRAVSVAAQWGGSGRPPAASPGRRLSQRPSRPGRQGVGVVGRRAAAVARRAAAREADRRGAASRWPPWATSAWASGACSWTPPTKTLSSGVAETTHLAHTRTYPACPSGHPF